MPEIDPGIPLDRPGPPRTSICTQNQPRRPILRPFRGDPRSGSQKSSRGSTRTTAAPGGAKKRGVCRGGFTPGFLIHEFLAGRKSSIFLGFRPEIDPGTPLDRRDSPGTSICTKSQPRRKFLRPFRGFPISGNHYTWVMSFWPAGNPRFFCVLGRRSTPGPP